MGTTCCCPRQHAGYERDILIVAGGKIIEPRAIWKLMEAFRAEGCDLAFLTDRNAGNPTLERVLRDDDGCPAAIVEVSETRRSKALEQIEALLAGRVDGD